MKEKTRIIAATQNRHKIREIQQVTRDFDMEIIPRDEAGIPPVEIEEDGETFEANSLKKAKEIMKLCGEITIADDSGLEVDGLDGEPGVYSARYAGVEADDAANRRKLMEKIKGLSWEERTGRFVAVITMVWPDGETLQARGTVEGHVIPEERGDQGFGYDPMFIPQGYEKTFGEFDPEKKNAISHRGNALRKLRTMLKERVRS